MIGISQLQKIEDFIVEEIAARFKTVFLVEIKMSASNDIKVFLDADDGMTIEKCTSVNKALYKYIEESELFPGGNFSLEVSSPGVDEPLKLLRQYKKSIGRKVEVLLNDGTKVEGKLLDATDEKILIEEKTGKGNKVYKSADNFLKKHTWQVSI
jgi:ribosome maturation factor RimP